MVEKFLPSEHNETKKDTSSFDDLKDRVESMPEKKNGIESKKESKEESNVTDYLNSLQQKLKEDSTEKKTPQTEKKTSLENTPLSSKIHTVEHKKEENSFWHRFSNKISKWFSTGLLGKAVGAVKKFFSSFLSDDKEKEQILSSATMQNTTEAQEKNLETNTLPFAVKQARDKLIAHHRIENPTKHHIEIADISSKTLWVFDGKKVSRYPMNTSSSGIGFQPNSLQTPTGNFTLSVKNNTHNPTKSAGQRGQKNILGATIAMHGGDKKNKNTFNRNVLLHGWPVQNGSLSGSTGCIHVSGETAITLANAISSRKKHGGNAYLRIIA